MNEWEGLTPPYRTIVADPPWEYTNARGTQTRSRRGRSAVTAEGNYSTLRSNEVAALPIADIAADDAHLYLWTTNPILPQAFAVLDAWGFNYITTLTWRKLGTLGMGFYFRGETEHVLFGVRGKLPIAAEARERNWIEAPRRGHSVKPAEFFDLVERVSPAPRVELFARQPRLGWDHWGLGYEQAS